MKLLYVLSSTAADENAFTVKRVRFLPKVHDTSERTIKKNQTQLELFLQTAIQHFNFFCPTSCSRRLVFLNGSRNETREGFHSLWNMCVRIFLTCHVIGFSTGVNSEQRVLYTSFLTYVHKKKSTLVRSGERNGQLIEPLLPIQDCGTSDFNKSLTARLYCSGAQCCWELEFEGGSGSIGRKKVISKQR